MTPEGTSVCDADVPDTSSKAASRQFSPDKLKSWRQYLASIDDQFQLDDFTYPIERRSLLKLIIYQIA